MKILKLGLSVAGAALTVFTGTAAAQSGPSQFYTLTPCRLVDTRNGSGGPIYGQTILTFAANNCGIPTDASALAANIASTNATSRGYFRVFPAGFALPTATTNAMRPLYTRATQAIVAINGPERGSFSVFADYPAGDTADFILDVSGFFVQTAVNVLDFFVNTTPSCQSPSPAPCSGGPSFLTIQPSALSQGYTILSNVAACAGVTTYLFRKGGDFYPWESETYWARDGWLMGAAEYHYSGNYVTYDRIFREQSTMKKGSRYMPLSLPTSGSGVYEADPFYVEEWVDASNQYSCNEDHLKNPPSPSEGDYSITYYAANTMSAILDCRAYSNCSVNYADFVVHTEYWGAGNVETYVFGRWLDPRNNRYEGLGLIEWAATGPAYVPSRLITNSVVLDGLDTGVPCTTCPD
jgi:hypothetical protein